ncbi:MAG: hypothetical protein KA354_11470 [Phycisphaerae bacterium]|nr:hypothetical protein [Phycisphaerae bacterium]
MPVVLTLAMWAASLVPAGYPGLVIPIDPTRSRVDLTICSTLQGLQKCDTDSSTLSGYCTVDLDSRSAPTTISLQDFDARADRNMSWQLSYGWLGRVDVSATNIRFYHAQPGIQPFWSLGAEGDFTAYQVPYFKEGLVVYTATALVCTLLQGMGLPCSDTMDLATEPVATEDISGTAVIRDGVLTFAVSVPVQVYIDPDNPDTGEVTGMAYLTGSVQIPVPCDFDDDGDVDLSDFGHLQRCLSGREVPQTAAGCEDTPLDFDTDVDGDDVALFLECLSGAEIPGDPDCLTRSRR